ncbi:LysR substrate-binding domain-containing protein [Anaerotignum sp.]
MNLYQLRYFVTLAETSHFGKAAEKLCIAQPSLSHAIAQLEAELGVTLFERKNRSSSLTKEGRQFLSYVEKSLEILDSGIQTMERIARGEGVIELGFLRTLGISFIPELAADFLRDPRGKNVRFQFHSGVSQPLLQGLKDGKFDMVFCTKIDSEKSIEFIPVSKQDLVLIVPRAHPLANRYTVDLTETLPYPHVYFAENSGLRVVIDQLFDKIGKRPQIAYEIQEDQVIAGLVAQGFGIAVVPYMEELLRLNVKIIQISYPYWERNFYMATLKDHYLPPAVQKFKQFVMEKHHL